MTVPPADMAALGQLSSAYWAMSDLVEDIAPAELFEPEAVFELGSLTLEGLPAIEDFFAGRAESMREQGRTTRHFACNFLILPVAADQVRVRSNLMVFSANGEIPLTAGVPSGIADTLDTCRRAEDGRWLFHRKTIRSVFVGPGAASFAR